MDNEVYKQEGSFDRSHESESDIKSEPAYTNDAFLKYEHCETEHSDAPQEVVEADIKIDYLDGKVDQSCFDHLKVEENTLQSGMIDQF